MLGEAKLHMTSPVPLEAFVDDPNTLPDASCAGILQAPTWLAQ